MLAAPPRCWEPSTAESTGIVLKPRARRRRARASHGIFQRERSWSPVGEPSKSASVDAQQRSRSRSFSRVASRSSSRSSSSTQPPTSAKRAIRRTNNFDAVPASGTSRPSQHVGKAGLPDQLEVLLDEAVSLKRSAVGEVMFHCMEKSAQAHICARQLADRVMHRQPGQIEISDMAVLFCISDLLYNSRYAFRCPGAASYRHAFQDLLPSILAKLHEAMNHESSRREIHRDVYQKEHGRRLETSLAKVRIRQVFNAWREWEVFPLLFQQGLEAVAFGGILYPAVEEDSWGERRSITADEHLSCRSETYAVLDSTTLERQCRTRALIESTSAATPPRATMLARLDAFELYWVQHSPPGTIAAVTEATAVARRKKGDGPGVQPLAFDRMRQRFTDTRQPAGIRPVEDGVSDRNVFRSADSAASPDLSRPQQPDEEDIDGFPIEVLPKPRTNASQASTAKSLAPAPITNEEDIDGEPIGVLELQRWRASQAMATQRAKEVQHEIQVLQTKQVTPAADSDDIDGIDNLLLEMQRQSTALVAVGKSTGLREWPERERGAPDGAEKSQKVRRSERKRRRNGERRGERKRGRNGDDERSHCRHHEESRSAAIDRLARAGGDDVVVILVDDDTSAKRRRSRSRQRRGRRDFEEPEHSATAVFRAQDNSRKGGRARAVEAAAAAASAAANAAAFLEARSRAPVALPASITALEVYDDIDGESLNSGDERCIAEDAARQVEKLEQRILRRLVRESEQGSAQYACMGKMATPSSGKAEAADSSQYACMGKIATSRSTTSEWSGGSGHGRDRRSSGQHQEVPLLE